MIKDNERRILRMSMMYFKKYKNLAVPHEFKFHFEGKDYDFGAMLGHVKNYFNSKDDPTKKHPMVYSQKLLQFLQKLDPRVFENFYARNLYREEKEQKLLKHFRRYYEQNGDLAIKHNYRVKDDVTGEIVPLGAEIVLMRQFVNGNRRSIYDQEFLDEIKAMDSKVFDFKYPKKCKSEKLKKTFKDEPTLNK